MLRQHISGIKWLWHQFFCVSNMSPQWDNLRLMLDTSRRISYGISYEDQPKHYLIRAVMCNKVQGDSTEPRPAWANMGNQFCQTWPNYFVKNTKREERWKQFTLFGIGGKTGSAKPWWHKLSDVPALVWIRSMTFSFDMQMLLTTAKVATTSKITTSTHEVSRSSAPA